jgi:hypothetical protein
VSDDLANDETDFHIRIDHQRRLLWGVLFCHDRTIFTARPLCRKPFSIKTPRSDAASTAPGGRREGKRMAFMKPRPFMRRALIALWGIALLLFLFGRSTAAHAAGADPSGTDPAGALSHADDSLHGYKPGQTDANIIHAFYSINILWVLICGFLVMFMQTGFALLETGLVRAKNAAHTMSMNFLVYALAIISFWAVGFGLMCGGVNGIPHGASTPPIGGPAGIGGVPQLNHMVYVSSASRSACSEPRGSF